MPKSTIIMPLLHFWVVAMIDKCCISINAQCNIACKYCHFYENNSLQMHKNKEFTQKELDTILSNILHYATINAIPRFSIGFAGGGEPLLSWDMLAQSLLSIHKKDTDKRLCCYIITNGVLLDSVILQTYKHLASFVKIVISLDGDCVTHNANRIYRNKKGTHAIVMKNIGLYKSLFNRMPDINLCVGILSLERKQEIADFLLDNDFCHLTFTRLFHCNDSTQEISQKQFMDFVHFFTQYPFIIRNIEAIKHNKKDCIMYGNVCGVGSNNIFYFDKKIYPCMRFIGDNVSCQYAIGKYDDSLERVQQSMQRFKKPITECYYEEYL